MKLLPPSLEVLQLGLTCSISSAVPLCSTSISRAFAKKSLNTLDNFSGFCSSGVPLVAIKYNAWRMYAHAITVYLWPKIIPTLKSNATKTDQLLSYLSMQATANCFTPIRVFQEVQCIPLHHHHIHTASLTMNLRCTSRGLWQICAQKQCSVVL